MDELSDEEENISELSQEISFCSNCASNEVLQSEREKHLLKLIELQNRLIEKYTQLLTIYRLLSK